MKISKFNAIRAFSYRLLLLLGILVLTIALALSCNQDDGGTTVVVDVDTDGDGILDRVELDNGTDEDDPCDPPKTSGYTGYDADNVIWLRADCDGDGNNNFDELTNGTDPYSADLIDSDGDGLTDKEEDQAGSDKNNPCDPVREESYADYDVTSSIWANADCDDDGFTNGEEHANGDNPYLDEHTDTDGDGISDFEENANSTDSTNPCDPMQVAGYTGYDSTNMVWANADCDGDQVSNADEVLANSDPYNDDLLYPVAQFLPKLSQLQVFKGNLNDLEVSLSSEEYELTTPLFTDYSSKLRTIGLPQGGQMQYNGEGLLQFPDNTVITKTFYYPLDDQNPSSGKKIIETRVLIKQNGTWQMANYLWNTAQTDADLDQSNNSHIVNVTWVQNGSSRTIDYEVPGTNDCNRCHNIPQTMPIGPKARALNFTFNGLNQLQRFINRGWLSGVSDVTSVAVLPNWEDTAFSIEERARAYMDVNCAHCHQPGGYYDSSVPGRLNLRYETSLSDSKIDLNKTGISFRVNNTMSGIKMPQIGTTVKHVEGVQLIQEYINSL